MKTLISLSALLALITLSGCGQCRGTYTERDSAGNLKKFNEHLQGGQCVKDNVALSRWESSSEARRKKNVKCKPQPQFASRTLASEGNFYSYRDGRIFLDLNSQTGEYTKLTLADGKNGEQIFSRLVGCFYERNSQILLDVIDVASSQYFDPMEIFTYTAIGSNFDMVRFDDSKDWDYRFCPYLNVPWGFCDLLKNGNEMFFPNLTPAEQSSLLSDALLIRKQFNYRVVASSTMTNAYNAAVAGRKETVAEDYQYAVASIVDTPRYLDQAWAEYVRGTRPIMPDITSSTMPPVCYSGKKNVTNSDGSSGSIYGQICYVDGQYTFQ